MIITSTNTSHLKVLSVGIRNEDDLYDICDVSEKDKSADQKMNDEFSQFVGYFSSVMILNEIPKKQKDLRFSIYVFSYEPIECAKRIPVHIPEERTIISSWPSKPEMNFGTDDGINIEIGSASNGSWIKQQLIRKKSSLINKSSAITSKRNLQQYFLDWKGNKDIGMLEIFQHSTTSIFAPQF
ncbi:MAG: hypothetical protein EZS28_054260, partial [Streblomastix strix]